MTDEYTDLDALHDQIDVCVKLKDNWFRECKCKRDGMICNYCDTYGKARKVATYLRVAVADREVSAQLYGGK